MAANIVQMKNNTGNKQYPVTTSAAVGMSDGSGSLDSKFSSLYRSEGFVQYDDSFSYQQDVNSSISKNIGDYAIPKNVNIKILVNGSADWSRCYIAGIDKEGNQIRFVDNIQKGSVYNITNTKDTYSIYLHLNKTIDGNIDINIEKDNIIHLLQDNTDKNNKTLYGLSYNYSRNILTTEDKTETVDGLNIKNGDKIIFRATGTASWSRVLISAYNGSSFVGNIVDFLLKEEEREYIAASDITNIRVRIISTSTGFFSLDIKSVSDFDTVKKDIALLQQELPPLVDKVNELVSYDEKIEFSLLEAKAYRISAAYKANDIIKVSVNGTAEWSRLLISAWKSGSSLRLQDNAIKGETYEVTLPDDCDQIGVELVLVTNQGTLNFLSVKRIEGSVEAVENKVKELEENITALNETTDKVNGLVGYDEISKFQLLQAKVYKIPVNYKAGDSINFIVGGTAEWSRLIVSAYQDNVETRLQDNVVKDNSYNVKLQKDFNYIGVSFVSVTTTGTLTFESAKRIEGSIEVLEKQVDNIGSVFTSSKNLLDENDEDFKQGYFVGVNGSLIPNSNYCASGYIPFSEEMDTLIATVDGNFVGGGSYSALYDKDRVKISSTGSGAGGYKQKWIEGTAFARFSFDNYTRGRLQVNAGKVYPYSLFGDKYDINKMPYIPNTLQVQGLISKQGLQIKHSELAATTELYNEEFPYFLKHGVTIVFNAEFENFSLGDKIEVGKGRTTYRGGFFRITHDKLQYIHYDNGETVKGDFTHSLSIQTFVKVFIYFGLYKPFIYLQTEGGEFKTEFDNTFENNGKLFVYSTLQLTNIELSANCEMFSSQVWSFGDSYFGLASNRVAGALAKLRFCKILMSGLSGGGSAGFFDEIKRLIKFGCPKIIIWALGMNDKFETYKQYVEQVKAYCEYNDITPVFALIPPVPNKLNEGFADYIKNLGVRYIDVIKAVGAQSNGTWYEGYNGDGVHPTAIGAMAIGLQWFTDVPEITACGSIEFDVKLTDSEDDDFNG